MTLTIAYSTCRIDPEFRWFFESLATQGDISDCKVVVVDFYADEPGRRDEVLTLWRASLPSHPLTHITPKPTPWQGKYRRTRRDYFAPANARNTALCHAPDGTIAYVDDLSVLLPGWLNCVRESMRAGYICLGAYRKVLGLEVQGGKVVSYRDWPTGWDSRWHSGNDLGPVPAAGSWLFGCSLAAPVEAFLAINGWDEDCDSMGGEDYAAGMMLQRAGWPIFYDRRMMTLECEECHHREPPFCHIDKGQSPNDASHAMLRMLMNGRNVAPNYFGAGGIRDLRRRVLTGEPFPLSALPEHDWRDGQPLASM